MGEHLFSRHKTISFAECKFDNKRSIDLTDSEYTVAALRLGINLSAATSSKKVGRVDPSPPSDTNDIVRDVYECQAEDFQQHMQGLWERFGMLRSVAACTSCACACCSIAQHADAATAQTD